MSVAIHYSSLLPAGREVFGLQIAINDWIRAYFRFARTERFTFLIGNRAEADELQALARQADVEPERLALLDRRFPEQNIATLTTVFRPEPDTRNLLWQRQLGGDFSFCGLAHAISGVEAGEVLQEYCLSPSEASDAIVCPSLAVRNAVRAFWDHYGEFLRQRFGASYRCPVQLPVIPLGVDLDAFEQRVDPAKRHAQRKLLAIGDDETVLLWVGRLSAAIKAHPLAMFQAAERAARLTGAKVRLLMVGYFIPLEAEAQFKALAKDVCHNADVTFVATDDPRFPDGLWAASDVFLSLIDNHQESFGLTPIEAMAAGLPRVISDWDGYRDSVEEGEDGFLVRTMQPPPGTGFELTTQVLSGREIYGGFLAKAALSVSVDAEMAGDRLARLIVDHELRRSMGAKAKRRARETYGWNKIIPIYEDLWLDLAEKRQRGEKKVFASALPTLPDPYRMYETYPSRAMAEGDRLVLGLTPEEGQRLMQHDINLYAKDMLLGPSDVAAVLAYIATQKETTIEAICTQFQSFDRPRLWRTLGWVQKLGIVKNSPSPVERA